VSVRNGRHNFIWQYPDGRMQLYDLVKDPAELEDISKTDQAALQRMAEHLSVKMSELESTETLLQKKTALTEEQIERLKSLGYIN
jgi:hypothetical protein